VNDTGKESLLNDTVEFFSSGPLQAATALQNTLAVDETSYRFAARSDHNDARAYLLYGVLDEVIKAGTGCIRWNEFLQEKPGEEPIKRDQRQHDHIGRVVLEAVIDEQNLWTRKLIEALVDLICFSQTNEQTHYRMYLAAKHLDAFLRLQEDFKEFYACESGNVSYSIASFTDDIRRSWEDSIPNLWFLKVPRHTFFKPNYYPHPAHFLQSTWDKFRRAVKISSDDERLILGMSYEHAFGGSSRSIHLNIGGPTYNADIERVRTGIGRVGLLCLHVVNKAHHLSGIKPQGVAEEVAALFSGGSVAPKVMARIQESRFELGDIIITYNTLAEVLEERSSKYGYKAYRIRYLSKPPLPETPEEWVPSKYVHRRLIRRRDARAFFETELSKMPEGQKIWDALKDAPDEKLFEALRRSLVDIANQGLLFPLLSHQ